MYNLTLSLLLPLMHPIEDAPVLKCAVERRMLREMLPISGQAVLAYESLFLLI